MSQPPNQPPKNHWYDDEENRRKLEIGGGVLFGAVAAGLYAKHKYGEQNDVSIVSGEGYTISCHGNYLYCGYANYVGFTSYYFRSNTWIFTKRNRGWTIKLKDYELYLGFSNSGERYVSVKPSYFRISEKGDDVFKITQSDIDNGSNAGFNTAVVRLV